MEKLACDCEPVTLSCQISITLTGTSCSLCKTRSCSANFEFWGLPHSPLSSIREDLSRVTIATVCSFVANFSWISAPCHRTFEQILERPITYSSSSPIRGNWVDLACASKHIQCALSYQILSWSVYRFAHEGRKKQILPYFQSQHSVMAPPNSKRRSWTRVHNYKLSRIQRYQNRLWMPTA